MQDKNFYDLYLFYLETLNSGMVLNIYLLWLSTTVMKLFLERNTAAKDSLKPYK